MIWLYIAVALILIILAVCALYRGLTYRRYSICADKLSAPIRIVHISDLHSIYRGKNQSVLMRKIDDAAPDIVALTGDIFDCKRNDTAAVSFLKQVSKYPCFFAPGNHEYRSGDFDGKMSILRQYGVHILIGESTEYHINSNRIIISGADDPKKQDFYDRNFNHADSLKKSFSALDTSKFNLLLAHNNSRINEYKKYPFDLVLSGHAHGGQFRIPFIMNGFFVRDQGFLPKYAGGMYTHGALTHIVSRGVSANPVWCPRIFNPTELVVIDIAPKKA